MIVEDDMFPYLVTERHGIELFAKARQEIEVLGRIDDARRVQRVVEEHHLRLRREGLAQHRLIEAPMRRSEPHELRHAARAAHERQIGVVHRLEQHHLVTGSDEGEERAGDRLGRARGDHDLGVGVEADRVMMRVMGRDRLTQLRQAHHRRILVPAGNHRLGGLAAHVLRARIVGKALAEIYRLMLSREA